MSYDPMFTAIMKAATDPANCKDLKEQQMIEDYYNRLMKAEPKRSPYIYYEDGNSTTSVSSSIPTLSRRCVVCGKSTSSRCSACASNGTQWMYFCGKDHQMLIWPLHKRVCGKRSTPWSWPPLTKKEMNEILELSTRPVKGPDGATSNCQEWLADGIKEMFPSMMVDYKPGMLDSMFKSILGTKLEPSDGSPLASTESSMLVDLRSKAWLVSGTSGKYFDNEPEFEEMLAMLVQQPFNFLAHFESRQVGDLSFNPDELSNNLSLWSDLQHHLTILLSFVCLCWQRGIGSVEYMRMEAYRQHAYDETMKYCREVIKPIDEEMAKYLAWNLITPLLQRHSQMVSSDSVPTM